MRFHKIDTEVAINLEKVTYIEKYKDFEGYRILFSVYDQKYLQWFDTEEEIDMVFNKLCR